MMKKAAYGKSMKAKAGTKKVKKAGYGGKAASMVPKGKSRLKKPKSSQKGLKALPTTVRNKMGFAKKGKAVTKAKSGMKKKKCKHGCK
tara:strand:- start:34 stop:297 length:264 start_codon:yes stop_codon:yes gene_type:complete